MPAWPPPTTMTSNCCGWSMARWFDPGGSGRARRGTVRRRWPGIGLGQRERGALRRARGRDFTKPVAAASTMTTPWSVAPDVPPAASRRRSAHRCPAIPAANLRICPALIWMNSCAARFSAAPSGLASAARCRPTSRCAVKTRCMRSLSCRGWSISQPRGEPPRTSKKKADRTRPARRHAFATPGRAGRASSSPKVHHQVPEGRFKQYFPAFPAKQGQSSTSPKGDLATPRGPWKSSGDQ